MQLNLNCSILTVHLRGYSFLRNYIERDDILTFIAGPSADDVEGESVKSQIWLLTVHVEASGVGRGASPVGRRAGVGAPVRRPHPCQVHVTHHRATHAHVLAHHQPAAMGTVGSEGFVSGLVTG